MYDYICDAKNAIVFIASIAMLYLVHCCRDFHQYLQKDGDKMENV